MSDDTYIPQDHFVHQVNLYLLGIYIFSYHKNLHHRAVDEISVVKRSLWKTAKNDNLEKAIEFNEYIEFANLWAHFVLYHDLGYPLERIFPSKRKENEGFLKPYSNLVKSTFKDITIKILSKFIMIDTVINSDLQDTLQDIYFDNLNSLSIDGGKGFCSCEIDFNDTDKKYQLKTTKCPPDFDANELIKKVTRDVNRIKDSLLLRDINNIEKLFSLVAFLPPQNLYAVLEDIQTGIPQLIITLDNADFDTLWFNKKEHIPPVLLNHKSLLRDSAFSNKNYFGKKYIWRYFAYNIKQDFESFISPFIEKNDYGRIKKYIQEIEEFYEAELLSTEGLNELEYIIYQELNKLLGYQFDDSEIDNKTEIIIKKLALRHGSTINTLPDLIARTIKKYIKNEITENKDFNPLDILNNNKKDKAANQFIEHIINNRSVVESILVQELNSNISKNLDIEILTKEFVKKLRQYLQTEFTNDTEPIADLLKDMEFNKEFSLDKIDSNDFKISQHWEGLLKKIGLNDWETIRSNYRPDWAQKDYNSFFVDHGLFAGLLLISNLSIYKMVFNCIQDEKTFKEDTSKAKLIRILTKNIKYKNHQFLNLKNDFYKTYAGLAISLHNLNPKHFRDDSLKSYKTKANINPFSFIAIFSDAIQKWDREKLLNIVTTDVDGVIPGSLFDIQIQDDLIYISLASNKIDMGSAETTLRKELKDFLYRGDKLIKLQFSEKP